MSAPDPDSLSLLEKLIGAAAAVALPVMGARTWLEKRFDRKADKSTVSSEFQEVRDEMTVQRGHIAKVFDQIRENEQRAQDRHERLLEAVHSKKGN